MGFGGFGYGGYGMGLFGWILQILVLIGIVYLVVYLVKGLTHRESAKAQRTSAKDIAAQRFARITEEEYNSIRNSL